jgi:hypothetical protein
MWKCVRSVLPRRRRGLYSTVRDAAGGGCCASVPSRQRNALPAEVPHSVRNDMARGFAALVQPRLYRVLRRHPRPGSVTLYQQRFLTPFGMTWREVSPPSYRPDFTVCCASVPSRQRNASPTEVPHSVRNDMARGFAALVPPRLYRVLRLRPVQAA